MDISMSVDGFVTGPELDKWPGLGRGGTPLHAWREHDEGRRLSEATFAASGAVVTSRTVYDLTGGWGEDGFFQMPVIVVTQRSHKAVHKGDTTFTFETGGVVAAIEAAATVASDMRVHVMGGG